MAKPQVYINVSQCAAIVGAAVLGGYYIHTIRQAEGIGKKQRVSAHIKRDLAKVGNFFVRPFRNYF